MKKIQVRIEVDCRQPRHERDEHAAGDQHDRRGQADAPGRAGQDCHGSEQADEDLRGSHSPTGLPNQGAG